MSLGGTPDSIKSRRTASPMAFSCPVTPSTARKRSRRLRACSSLKVGAATGMNGSPRKARLDSSLWLNGVQGPALIDSDGAALTTELFQAGQQLQARQAVQSLGQVLV